MKIVKLRSEPWRYVLFEVNKSDWYCAFSYSPKSFIDLSMTIRLTRDEKIRAMEDSSYLREMADDVRNNYEQYLTRAEKFSILKKFSG